MTSNHKDPSTMTNKDQELLPCERCGGNDQVINGCQLERGQSWSVMCACGHQSPFKGGTAEAIAGWNTRTALLPCQVSDAMRRLEKFHDTLNVNRHYMTGQTCREIQRDIRIALDALTTASTIPTDGETERDFRIHLWNALRAEVSIGDDACYRVINRAWDSLAALSIQTISGKGMREALEEARPIVAAAAERALGTAKVLGKGRAQEIADEAAKLLAKIDAALVDQGERG